MLVVFYNKLTWFVPGLPEKYISNVGRLTATNSFLHVSYSALLKFLPQQSQNSSSLLLCHYIFEKSSTARGCLVNTNLEF